MKLDNLFLISSLFSYLVNTKGTGYFKAQEYGNCHIQFYQHYLIFSQIYVITFLAEVLAWLINFFKAGR